MFSASTIYFLGGVSTCRLGSHRPASCHPEGSYHGPGLCLAPGAEGTDSPVPLSQLRNPEYKIDAFAAGP